MSLKITKHGKVTVSERDGKPYIEITGFEFEGGSAHGAGVAAIKYAVSALRGAIPWPWRLLIW